MLTRPSGLGWWVAFERAIDDGPKAADLAKALAVCEATGADWLCLRAGDGGHADADLTEGSILAFKSAGKKVFLWPFEYGSDASLAGSLAILKHWRGLCLSGGAPAIDGIVLNAEFDFLKNASPEHARAFVASVRAQGWDYVGHAPPDYAGGRGDGSLAALDEVCDGIFPQTYAWEHNDLGHVHTINEVLALYRKRGIYRDRVNPVLCSYRPLFRGYTTPPEGLDPEEKAAFKPRQIPTSPLANEAELVAKDVVEGLDFLEGCEAPSIYTIDALHFASRPGVGAAVLTALTALTARAKPAKQTLPDGGLALADTDRAPATSIADEVHRLMEATPTRPDSPQAVATTAADITWSGEPPDSKGAAG